MSLQVPDSINFPAEEEKVLQLWERLDAYQESLRQSRHLPRFTFYDGPPFATGLPHYGHILAGTIKDIVTRHAHQSGQHVVRRFGWDCHGLPVEYEIDKRLNISGPDDVERMGVEAYNKECRSIVMRYSAEWETIVNRLGRWVDFRNDYKTMYPWFMESIWWVFKQLFVKGLVYRGFKVMPFSTGCNTPLSNFEAGQNYKEVVDPAVIVSFPLEDEKSVSLVAWTTTPWTLPSNLALCVNPDMMYVRVRERASGRQFILMEARLSAMYKSAEEYSVEDTFKGSSLRGRRYIPLFRYYERMSRLGAFQVLCDGYVTDDSGTGVVHQAPYFGEDDYRVCLAAGVVRRDSDLVCPVDSAGRFTQPVSDFVGSYVKDADKLIVRQLKDEGRLVSASTCKHSYPFCWRSDTPLLYKAVPSWFVRVEQLSQRLLDNNSKTYWVPEFVKEKRFSNWLRDARDWAISRNRYWGTPMPLWTSDDLQEVVCVGSIDELERLTGERVTDLHRESVDHLTIPAQRPGHPPLRRVSEVFDCWFESGSMPYAQAHYPFENKAEFERAFPADFIAEGIDQTRGWFYTLLVLSTALFDRPPFRNLIANGLVLAADGQKMSKRKQNYPDPMVVVNKYGADALRLYLINSPVVRGENLRFKEDGVRDILKDVFLPWYNAFRFLLQCVHGYQTETGVLFLCDPTGMAPGDNLMDRWIVSCLHTLLAFVAQEMTAYRLYTVTPRLVRFVDNLTNWYVRLNRRRLKGEEGECEWRAALSTLYCVLFALCRTMAPFTPFLTETLFQKLRQLSVGEQPASVHFVLFPAPRPDLVLPAVEAAVALMQRVVDMGRVLRDRVTTPVKYPLSELIVVHRDPVFLDSLNCLADTIRQEMNVRTLTRSCDRARYGVVLRAEPNHRVLGARLKSDFQRVLAAVKALDDAALQQALERGEVNVCGHRLTIDELHVKYSSAGAGRLEAHSEGDLLVLLDTTANEQMVDEGLAREIINRVQKLRKKAALVPSDAVTCYYQVLPADSQVGRVALQHRQMIETALRAPLRVLTRGENMVPLISESCEVKGAVLQLKLVAGEADANRQLQPPFCSYVSVQLTGARCRLRGADAGDTAVVMLENPVGTTQLTVEGLREEVAAVFGLQHVRWLLSSTRDGAVLSDLSSVSSGTCLYAVVSSPRENGSSVESASGQVEGPAVSFVNLTCLRAGGSVVRATVLLENPCNCPCFHSWSQFQQHVRVLFGGAGPCESPAQLFTESGQVVADLGQLTSAAGSVLSVKM